MTRRETYLKALRNETVSSLVWAPNFDYWLSVNTAEGTLPEKYTDMSRNNIVRAVNGYIWHRTVGLKTVLDDSVKEIFTKDGDNSIRELRTPVGTVREVYSRTEGEHRAVHQTEHLIKDLASIRVLNSKSMPYPSTRRCGR